MHDLVQEMGHYIVRGGHPNNPEKHSRLWRQKEIEEMCSKRPITENEKIEAIYYYGSSLHFPKLVSHMKKLRLLDVCCNTQGDFRDGPNFLSDELRYIYWYKYPASPFPENFYPSKLVSLNLFNSLQEELWKDDKDLPCLKELELRGMKRLVRTPDFRGLPCLQKLTLEYCENLEEIHPSLGNHTSLMCIYVEGCYKLRKFPTIIHMKKLEILDISSCMELREFPKIKANMDSLINLHLEYVEIEVLPSSVGKYCTNLISLKLNNCEYLKSIEGNFHSLKHLKKFELDGFTQLEKLPKDLFNEKCCLEVLCFNMFNLKNTLRPSPPRYLSRFLKKLNLSGFRLKDGEIPSDICELSNLQELYLSDNDFSRLDFSLSQLTRLKLLNMSCCENLVELPELPSSLAILKADHCESLEVVGNLDINYKWLCQVSLVSRTRVIDGDRLLQTMLQGKTIENHCAMSLHLKDYNHEIAKGFLPRLCVGSRCRLKLPENWYNHFSGFLICTVSMGNFDFLKITMEKNLIGFHSQHDVFWEEANMNFNIPYYNEYGNTWVGYVPFSSFRHTTWWDEMSNPIHFSIDTDGLPFLDQNSLVSGVGVTLIPNKNQTETTTTNSFSESSNDYTCRFRIGYDSKSDLKCHFML